MESIEARLKLAALDRDRMEDAVNAIHALRADCKFQDMVQHYAPHAILQVTGHADIFPLAGRYEGVSGILDFFRSTTTEIEMFESETLEVLVDCDRAFSRRRVFVRHRGAGKPRGHEIWDVFRFENGLVVDQVKMIDTAAFLRLQNR